MFAKKNKKPSILYIVERRKNSKNLVKSILKKKWKDITGIHLSILYENKWTTERISRQFNQSILTIINRIRFH